MLNEWIEKNHLKLKGICSKYDVGINTDDLFQCCIEQFLTNKKVQQLPNEKWIFFFTRIVMNNALSTSSRFYYIHKKNPTIELFNQEIEADEYKDDGIDLEWVTERLKKLKETDWYYARLMELYIEENCSLTKLSKRTLIPMESVSRDIKKIRKQLLKLRDDFRSNN